ncbi:chromatin target of PRMT1b [Megalobrama amblycephala]|uniref:chromatin target of PRMT1b n=1 Tax=Megalobrama amblycephala TaxID=75352 RepID=UPI0020144F08|nr:chromatin target of PRMT1b [Megalobrama amblycephala]XP_048009305.1 chromatin target of PRMT1b [Megalobrama amblycephala]XP_048009306.1 chromatin target of PRMT1b [Megalobrama amblycephala]
MNPLDPQKIILNSTCTVSLHDRFSSLLKHQPTDVMDITAAVKQQTAASLKNQRLALEMANRPSVLAALHNNINNQLCKVSVKARLGHPLGRVGMVGLQGQMRGGGGRRGLVKGFYTRKNMSTQQGVVNSLGVQKGCVQQKRGGIINLTGAMRTRGGGAIRRTEGNAERQVLHPGTAQGGGRFMSVRGAYSGCSRARFNRHQVPSREQLDEQLDEYMSMSKSHLDAELDAYMAQVDLEDMV